MEIVLRVIEYPAPAVVDLPKPHRVPASLIGVKLIDTMQNADRSIVYVALGEAAANRVADAIRCLDPDLAFVTLPPWDCLPFDRVAPSRASMGRRMDALRVWSQPSSKPRLLITSLDVTLQCIPPSPIIQETWFKLAVGDVFDRQAFTRFVRCTGYIEEGIVDDPGELAFRDDVIDIFPAGAAVPMRILLTDDGSVLELRSYDPVTQRTTETVERMVFGPASEAIIAEGDLDRGELRSEVSERTLFQLYGEMQTVFDIFGDVAVAFEEGMEERLVNYLDIINEARSARRRFDSEDKTEARSLYLGHTTWARAVDQLTLFDLDHERTEELPQFAENPDNRRAFVEFAAAQSQAGRTVVLAGEGQIFDGLIRRLEHESETKITPLTAWKQSKVAKPGALMRLTSALDHGFATSDLTVITVKDILGELTDAADITMHLAEPDLHLGDVVVHEDHGIGVLKNLESLSVENVIRDAARLEYRDGASLLVPMDEFGKLWRYGSEPTAVTLDRLHTDAWSKRRVMIDKDLRAAARHLLRLAMERQDAVAEAFVPPQVGYAKFVRRFPYAETAHQTAAIKAVLQDLGSGTVMSRLICGDVGFGKTEVALRAAAAVALAGGQVVVIAPTTVLARQHFSTFERRFADTGIRVAMLSRVVGPKAAKEIKAGLAIGEIGVVVATQAILAKDVRFRHLGLLIVDEEHRFGTREKQAMKALAPLLHTLTMSATPIPRTLQSAMIGVQDVSLLAMAPSKRRPVRTTLTPVDRASIRVALMREHRRGGQSFLVAPQIEDLGPLQKLLGEIVPELSIRVAHGKMKASVMDEIMVGFADGDGDVLLSTNIIESGLDVPRANTIFVWRADRFGLAQLHQLRGRVGRGKSQGNAFLLTSDGAEISEETRSRLSIMVENDRLGAGLAISMQDLDLRGGGDIAGEGQAGHMKLIGVSLYQKLLERSVLVAKKQAALLGQDAVVNLGTAGLIPEDYVSDGAVRLNLYARLFRAVSHAEVDGFSEEFEDRFGELPEEVSILFRLVKLRIHASRLGIGKLEAGPVTMAITFATKPTKKLLEVLTRICKGDLRDGRLIFDHATPNAVERIAFFEKLFAGNSHSEA